MQSFIDTILNISNFIWGIPMLVIFMGGAVFLTFRLGFFQFRHLKFILNQTFGKIFEKKHEGEGTITAFQAATAALASSVGASNIVGVPVAIAFGGPGAIFWMWLTGLLGSATKFSEIVLGMKYREKNAEGNYVGGAMYYLKKGLKAPWLGALFAFCYMIELVPSVSAQTVSLVQTAATVGIPGWVTGLVVVVLVSIVVFGGIKRIGQVTEKLVPFMTILHLAGALIIIVINIDVLPSAIGLIFKSAFTPVAAAGGFAGAGIAQAMRWGIARGAYSNEAGQGSAPMAHSAAITDHPVRQAMWGVFEIIVDTLIVCTMTALVVLVTGMYKTVPSSEAASIPSLAFQSVFGDALGGGIVTMCMFLFVLSTVIICVFYGEKLAEYLFGTNFSKFMRIIYLAAVIFGCVGTLEFLYNFLDILLAIIIVPNMIGLVLMSGQVKESLDEFFGDPKFYPGAKLPTRRE